MWFFSDEVKINQQYPEYDHKKIGFGIVKDALTSEIKLSIIEENGRVLSYTNQNIQNYIHIPVEIGEKIEIVTVENNFYIPKGTKPK